MRRTIVATCVLAMGVAASAQESDVTTVTTKTTTIAGDADLMSQLWQFEDATPLDCGKLDLRLGFRWETASAPANLGDSDDDFVLTPALVWGVVEGLELSARVPVWVGDGGDAGALDEGNADTHLGVLWRFMEQGDPWPAMALSGTLRVPTGDNSNKVDAELRLVMTNEYDSGVRSHLNGFVQSVNGNSDPGLRRSRGWWGGGSFWGDDDDEGEGLRHFQWGVVIGADGPLCADGAVRWVADYMHRSSHHYGASNINMLELGWEWEISEVHNLGMSFQIGLDDNEDTANFGAGVMYSLSVG